MASNAASHKEPKLPPNTSIDRGGLSAGALFAPVHALNLPVFAAALLSGILLFSPTIRAMLLSGYSENIRGYHRWLGRGQIALALAIAALWMRSGKCCEDASRLLEGWRIAHVWIVGAVALGFAATGIVIASPASHSISTIDYSLAIHLWLTYLSCALAALHAFVALRSSRRQELIAASTQAGKL